MEELLFLLVAKLLDWPTIGFGIVAGLLAWSWAGTLVTAAAAALVVEVIIMFVRGWPIRPYWIAVGFLAAVPWTALGFLLRSVIQTMVRKSRSGA